MNRKRIALRVGHLAAAGFLFCLVLRSNGAAQENQSAVSNTFPSVAEVIGDHTFENYREQNIFFLRAIHDRYPAQWPALLEANITETDYVLNPDKLRRFVDELGEAMRDRDDRVAGTNLLRIAGADGFGANPDTDNPEILQAAARALIALGPAGRGSLAACFTPARYGSDPAALESLAEAIGQVRPADPTLSRALVAAAFTFTTTNGGIYPQCVATAVKNLLRLAEGPAAVQTHLQADEVLQNPARFQAVMEGIAAAQATQLSANLVAIQGQIHNKLAALTNAPGAYRDDLEELGRRMDQIVAGFQREKNDGKK